MTFKEYLEARADQGDTKEANEWLVTLVRNGRPFSLEILPARNRAQVLQRAMQHVLPQYRQQVRPMVVHRFDTGWGWMQEPWYLPLTDEQFQQAIAEGDDTASGLIEDYLRQWFPHFRWT